MSNDYQFTFLIMGILKLPLRIKQTKNHSVGNYVLTLVSFLINFYMTILLRIIDVLILKSQDC